MGYRKLTEAELKSLMIYADSPHSCHKKEYIDYVKKYYDNKAHSILVGINSEYNDEGYDNRVSYVLVYDKDGNELLPSKANSSRARKEALSLPLPIKYNNDNGYGSEEPAEDVVFYINGYPELYVKE